MATKDGGGQAGVAGTSALPQRMLIQIKVVGWSADTVRQPDRGARREIWGAAGKAPRQELPV